ncbi:MAG: MFS transporter [Candidatus Brocadiia bacterium]
MGGEPIGEADATRGEQTLPTGAPPAPQRKLWRVGTLTYTLGGLVILFSWLLWGDFAWSMRDRAVAPVVQMLVKKYGASDTVMGLLLSSLPLGISAILGPIISYRSDRHRGRWGRRIPYILAATPVAALAMAGLAFSQPIADLVRGILGSRWLAGVNLTLIVFGVFWTCFEFAAIIAGSVFGALINDVVPSSLLGRFYGLFRVLSLLAGILFNYWLIGQAELHSQWLFGGIAILYGVGVMMMCLRVKEGQYAPPPEVKPGERKSVFAITKVYFKECFSKPYYLWVFLGLTFGGISFWPINLFSVPFANSMGVNMEKYGKYSALSYVISLCLAYFLGVLVDRFHALRVSIVALLLYAIAMMAGLFYVTAPARFGVGWVAHCVLSGVYYTTSASLAQRLLPRSTFAQFNSAAGLVGAAIGMATSPLIGGILDWSGHQYRYTFLMGSGIAVFAAILLLIVHTRFMRYGGPKNYVAPE